MSTHVEPALFDLLELAQGHFADIRDATALAAAVDAARSAIERARLAGGERGKRRPVL